MPVRWSTNLFVPKPSYFCEGETGSGTLLHMLVANFWLFDLFEGS